METYLVVVLLALPCITSSTPFGPLRKEVEKVLASSADKVLNVLDSRYLDYEVLLELQNRVDKVFEKVYETFNSPPCSLRDIECQAKMRNDRYSLIVLITSEMISIAAEARSKLNTF